MYTLLLTYITLSFIGCSHKLYHSVGRQIINPSRVHQYGFRFIEHLCVDNYSRIYNLNFNSYAIMNYDTRQNLSKLHGRLFTSLVMVRPTLVNNRYSLITNMNRGGLLSFKYSNNTRGEL